MEFTNDCATLCFHKHSLRGTVADYVIACHEPQVDMLCLIGNTYDLFMKLMANYNDAKVRLAAKVTFEHIPTEELYAYHSQRTFVLSQHYCVIAGPLDDLATLRDRDLM